MHILGLLHAPIATAVRHRAAGQRAGGRRALGPRTHPPAGRCDGLRLPGLTTGPHPDRARERVLAGEYAGACHAPAQGAAMEALGWVGLAERHGHRPMELSGGEQQRRHRSIARERTDAAAGGRTDRQPGLGDEHRRPPAAAVQPRARPDPGAGHARSRCGCRVDRIIHMRDGLCERSESLVTSHRAEAEPQAAT